MAERVFVNKLSDNDITILNKFVSQGLDYQKIRARILLQQ
jgi:hypothetical protein